MIRITFLGTGGSLGVPILGCTCEICRSDEPRNKRLRSSVLLEIDNTIILIDAGPDLRAQLFKANVPHIDALLLTHGHNDHIAGLDELRSLHYFYQSAQRLFASPRALQDARLRYPYLFNQQFVPGVWEYGFESHSVGEAFEINGLPFFAYEAPHGLDTVTIFRYGSFAYATDVSEVPVAIRPHLRNLDTLVICALEPVTTFKFLGIDGALEVIDDLQPRQAYLTHINHSTDYTQASSMLPPHVALAYDGLQITIVDT